MFPHTSHSSFLLFKPLFLFFPFSHSICRWQRDCCLWGDGEEHEGGVATGAWKCTQLPRYLQAQGRRAPAGSQGAWCQHLHCAETSHSPHHLRHHCSASLPFRRRQSKARRRNNTYVRQSIIHHTTNVALSVAKLRKCLIILYKLPHPHHNHNHSHNHVILNDKISVPVNVSIM